MYGITFDNAVVKLVVKEVRLHSLTLEIYTATLQYLLTFVNCLL